MNNKFMILMAVIGAQMCYSSPSKIDAALARVKARYHIQKEDDYIAAAVNRTTIFDKKNYRCSDDYDLLGLILNKKPVVWTEFPDCLGNEKDIHLLLKHKDIRCAYIKHKQGSIYLMYSPGGRHKALALVKSALDLADQGHGISQHTDNTRFEYLTGVCLGYALDDIDFYFQRIAFHNIKGFWPETEEQINQFLANEWVDSQESIGLDQAKLQVSNWLREHSDTTLLQRDIDSYQKNNKDINIEYDVPYASFIGCTSIKSKLVYALNYVIANTLTLGGLIPCI